MNLVLRKGILRDNETYVFSLHVTDDSMEQEGVANIELHPNMPPAGGSCSLWADGEGPEVHTLLDRVHFKCTGERGGARTCGLKTGRWTGKMCGTRKWQVRHGLSTGRWTSGTGEARKWDAISGETWTEDGYMREVEQQLGTQ